jgi:hypothetical protein
MEVGFVCEHIVGQSSCIGDLADSRHGSRSCLPSQPNSRSILVSTHIGPFPIAKLQTPSSDVGDGDCYMTNALLRMVVLRC